MSRAPIDAFFIDGAAGRLFTVLRRSPGSERCVIFIPPFAEEMNRCRRQVAETAARLVDEGYSVLVPDLFGTGDSEGEFGDATWSVWLDDLSRITAWAEGEGLRADAVIATRLGCALLADCLHERALCVRRAVLWQPVDSGAAYLQQFLRLRVAASMARDQRETVAELLAQLERGDTLEVGGYALSPSLAAAIRKIGPQTYNSLPLEALAILQVGRAAQEGAVSSAAVVAGAAESPQTSVSVIEQAGGPYWASAETAFNPALCERTADWLTVAADAR